MARLKNEHKLLIVKMLAERISPNEVIEIMQKDYSVKVTPSQVSTYNPENLQGRKMSDEHKKLFHKWRAEFMLDFEAVPIANLRVQLEYIQGQMENLREMAEHSKTQKRPRSTIEISDAMIRQIELVQKMMNGAFAPAVSNAPPGYKPTLDSGSSKMQEIEALLDG